MEKVIESNEVVFKNLVKSILDSGNHVEFAINDPDNKGVIVNEWSVIDDDGIKVPDSWLTSERVEIEEEIAWKIVDELGLIYPIINDESSGEQLQ